MIQRIQNGINIGYITFIDHYRKIGFANLYENPYKRDFIVSPKVIGEELFMSLSKNDEIVFKIVTIKNKRHAFIFDER